MGGDPSHHQPPQRRKPSWASTLVAQACVFLALYATFAVWIPRVGYSAPRGFGNGVVGGGRSVDDVYFLSVTGGHRPALKQNQLLHRMDVAARIFDAKFVVDISEFGQSDPLLQNATRKFPSLMIPWYATTTKASSSKLDGAFHKQIAVSRDRNLSIILLNTGLWKDVKDIEKASKSRSDQIAWLTRTLASSSSNWHIIAGFHPLTNCEEESSGTEMLNYHDHINSVFMRHGVNMYLSKLGCAGHYSRQSSVTHMGNPGYQAEEYREPSTHTKISREIDNSFLVHRVSPLEIESSFINSSGDTISRHTLTQWGREVM